MGDSKGVATGSKGGGRGFCQWGRDKAGPLGGGTACTACQREKHRNSLVRIEWRLCGVLRAAKKRLQKAGRAR